MKAIVVHDFVQSLEQLRVSEVEQPQPNPDELLIQVAAAGVNFVDTLYARGKHQNNRSLVRPPFTLGLEFSGTVMEAPAKSAYRPGDRVFGDCNGSYSELLTLPTTSTSLQMVPPSWSFTDAAGLGATLPVAFGALFLSAKLQAGETVLVHSAAGGLGIMAVQVAVAMGCRVIATAGSESKCDYARGFGANAAFDYSQDRWWERVLEATDGNGANVIFDPVGLVESSLRCVAHRGRVLLVGFAGTEGRIEKIAMNRVLLKQVSIIGYRYGESLRRFPEERDRIWKHLHSLIESGKVRPTVHKCYQGLESVPQALLDLTRRKVSGKAVIQVEADGAQAKL